MKTVLITGTSRGIGRATAQKFLDEGWFVVGTAKSGEIDIDSPNFTSIKLNYLERDTIGMAVHTIELLGRKIDVLINNAGVWLSEGKNLLMEKLRTTLEVNLIGAVDFTEHILPLMSPNGHIIFVGSGMGSISEIEEDGWEPSYRISKVGLSMYSRTLAKRFESENKDITVSVFDPGWVRTDMGGAEAPRLPEEVAGELYELAVVDVETGQFWKNGKKRSW